MKKHLRLLFVSILLTAILCGVIAVHYIRNWAPAPAELESKTIQMPPAAVEPAPHVKSAPVIKLQARRFKISLTYWKRNCRTQIPLRFPACGKVRRNWQK